MYSLIASCFPSVVLSVSRLGGWARFQQLLQVLSRVAQREHVSIQVVTLRWLADQDIIPVIAPLGWHAAANRMWDATLGLSPTSTTYQRKELLERALGRGRRSFLTAKDVEELVQFAAA